MTQRLGIAAALLGDPGVLLFDEPINGLDPEGILWVRTLLKRLAAEGRAVFVSSHLMSEMALTADHLVVIGRGKLIADQPVAEFVAQSSRASVRVRTPTPEPLIAALTRRGAASTPSPTVPSSWTGSPPPPSATWRPASASPCTSWPRMPPRSKRRSWSSPTRASSSAPRTACATPAVAEGQALMVAAAPALRALPPGHYRFSGALRSEWTKLRTVRSTAWCVLATVVAGLGIGILATRQRGVALAPRRGRRQARCSTPPASA